jgi:hypothetical protein
MSTAENVIVPLLLGQLSVPLKTLPRHGHVAFTVWPCSTFLVETIAGWRLKESESLVRTFNPERLMALSELWRRLDMPAKQLMLQRCRCSRLLNGVRIVDLGSGTGIVGLALHALGAQRVVVTDMPKCMHLLEQNVEEWKTLHTGEDFGELEAVSLAWEQYLPGDVDRLLNGGGDQISDDTSLKIVIACDCVYGTDHIGRSPIIPIVRDFLQPESSDRLVLISYESRDDDIEESFWYQIDQCKELQRVLIASCDAEVSEGNEKEKTTYQVHGIFRR